MKKKMMRLFLAAIVFVLVFSVSAVSVMATDVTTAVASSEFYAHQGETFTTTIYIPDDANIVDFELTLNYDTELITLVDAVENEDIKGAVVFNTNNPGEIAINYTRTSKNVTSYMPLIDITFAIDENIGIGIYDCFTVDNEQTYVAHRLDESDNYEEVAFNCDFSKLQIYEMGDVNLSAKVDIGDATGIRRHLAGFTNSILTDFRLSLADTYFDQVIDIADASCLQRHLARFNVLYGNRVNITFMDINGNKVAAKSVLYNGTLNSIPLVPVAEGYSGGVWSQSATEYVAPNYKNLTKNVTLYAYYEGGKVSEAIEYYKRQLTEQYYHGDMPTNLSSDLNLWTTLPYQDGYYANFIWNSDSNYILNSTTGKFTKPTYPQEMTLTAKIISYDANNKIEAEDSISFTYAVPGIYVPPMKDAVVEWINHYFTDDSDNKYRVNYDVKLISKLSNVVIPIEGSLYDNFDIRLNWYQKIDGVEVPISQIKRTTSAQVNDYVCVATFNGKPLDVDGKIYVDDVEVTPIEQIEIRNYIIQQIAANMGTVATDGIKMWDNDTVYDTKVTWETGNADIAYVSNNIVELKDDAVTGSTLPLNARVSYATDDGTEEFVLSYNLTISCDNTVIKAPENMDPELYKAIKVELEENLGYRGDLTSAALANVKFVNLDLSDYPDITSLRGLSYCTNLRTLNISGLHITDGTMNQIATLSYLEAFVARGCGLDNLSDGGQATLRNAVRLKMIDLTDNNFTSLDSVFAEGVKYGSLREVYLSNNKLTDINALKRAPIVTYLSLSNNGLTTEGTAAIAEYPYLQYLSLAHNKIDSVEHLTGLKHLVELRLHHNELTNVRGLRTLLNLEILYLGHNQITDVGFLSTLTALEVFYVNDNNISDISALSTLNKLEIINVNNNNLSSAAVLRNYSGTLTEIYAENNNLTDFSFINGATKLHILMLAGNKAELAQTNMTTWLAGLTELEVLTLSDIKLTDLSFLESMQKLARLDIANCGLPAFTGETSNIDFIANCYAKLRILDISNNNMSGNEDELLKLRNLSLLTVLYADNICDELDVYTLTYSMPELMYISMENCGVDTLQWLYKYNNLAYVDLAGNDISAVSLESDFSNASIKSLRELYLDTNVPCTFTDAYRIADFNVEKLSLAGISVNRIEHLPYLDNVKYLNLSNTGLTTLVGDDVELIENYSVERYAAVDTIDVSGLEVDISALENLPKLNTVYAVGATDSKMFYEGNLHSLQRMYNAGVECYLYDKQTVYKPVATTEGAEILALLDDISCDVAVAADNVFSDNNPFMVDEINDFDITWSVSNTDNYEIVDNHLAVKDYTGIDDEELIVTAQITVYPDQAPVTRSFTIRTSILRASAEYFETDATGYSKQLTRGKTFKYDLRIKAEQTANFTNPVKPVVDYIMYDYVGSDGIPYVNILTVGENHNYSIVSNAPLNATATIKINIGHITKSGTYVNDVDEIHVPVTVASRTFTVTTVLNGGQLLDENGTSRDVFECVEDALIFEDLTVKRVGYIFEGWYTDAELKQLYSLDGSDAVMPSKNITLYAKWKAHSFNLKFDANGGTVSETSRLVLCDTAVGELPIPTRTGYTFNGWFTKDGKQITASSSMATAEDITVYAKWSIIAYKATWNGGTGYTITVKRTSSPNKGAATGTLSSGAAVYYGDVLSVTYTKADYYTVKTHGAETITVTGDVTSSQIYATAELNPVSNWVLASSLPEGAQVIEEKWSYTETTKAESKETSMEGFTQIGSYWVQSGSGSFQYSDKFSTYAPGFNTSNSIYKNLNKSPYTSYENETSKREVSTSWAGYVYWHWMYDCGGANAADRSIFYKSATGSESLTGNNYGYKYFNAFTSTTNFSGQTNKNWGQNDTYYKWYRVTDRSSFADTSGSYWFYRFDYYNCAYTDYYKMFQYQKIESKTSYSVVTESDTISDVQHWVQYRAR